MKFFKNITTLEDLKKSYKELARQLHPDMGGSTEKMQELNNEFNMLFPYYKNKTRSTAESAVDGDAETAQSFTRHFYTQNGWEGSRYDGNLSNKDIAKKIREFVKCVYPDCKFSITSNYLDISVYLMEAPHEAFIDPSIKNAQVNHYYIMNNKQLTEKAKTMFKTIYDYLLSYNYDDSDSMIDYFDTNFYINMGVGTWEKPFKVVQKTAKITDKTPTTKQRAASGEEADVFNADGYTYDIKEDTDTRDNSKIFIVKVLGNLTREEYKKVAGMMKDLGGYYSKFKHGFLFREYPDSLINA